MTSAIFKHKVTGKMKALPKFYQTPGRVDFQAQQGWEFLGLGTFEDFNVQKVEKKVRTRKPKVEPIIEPTEETTEETTEIGE